MSLIKPLKQWLFFSIIISISTFLLFFIIGCTWIGYEVKSQCRDAKREYGLDCAGSLILLLEDGNRGFRPRNSAVWALGQLGDSRALPVLKKYYTGNIPDKEPLDRTISQYELKKAINLVDGGLNITTLFWRHGID